MFKPN